MGLWPMAARRSARFASIATRTLSPPVHIGLMPITKLRSGTTTMAVR